MYLLGELSLRAGAALFKHASPFLIAFFVVGILLVVFIGRMLNL